MTDAVSREVAIRVDPIDGQQKPDYVLDAVSREFAVRVEPSIGRTTAQLVRDSVSREFQIYVNPTDANGNGIADLLEPTARTVDYYASSVPNTATAWRDEGEAAGDPGCGDVCPCNSQFEPYAYNGWQNIAPDSAYLVASFGNVQIPADRAISSVVADVMCRFNDGSSGSVDLRVAAGGQQLLLATQSFTSNTTCTYRFGGAGRVLAAPAGGWTPAAVANLSVAVRRSGGNATTLRVTAFRLTVTTVERDTDADGLSDSIDNCPNNANPMQQDCDGNGIGDACELLDYPQRDANMNGVIDACEDVAGWIGGVSGSFSNPANWSSGRVPGPGTALYLRPAQGATFSISTSGPVVVKSLVVAQGTVRLTLGAEFRVNELFTVSPGAALILDGTGSVRPFELGGFAQVRGGAKLEVGANARVVGLAGGSFATDALSTLAVVLRGGAAVPVELHGLVVFDGGFSAKLGALGDADLPLGRTFAVVSSDEPVASFYSALTAQGLGKKFLKVLSLEQLGFGSLVLEVADLAEFIRAVGGANVLSGGVQPTALAVANLDTRLLSGQAVDLFDDIAVTVRRTGPSGNELPGDVYLFKSDGIGGQAGQRNYATGLKPVAVESTDLDGDGTFDIAVLTETSGRVELFFNPSERVELFVAGPTADVGVGARYFGVDDITPAAFSAQLASLDAFLISNPATNTLRALVVSNGSPVLPPPNPQGVPTPPGPLSPIGPGGTSRDDGAFLATRSAPADSEYGVVTRYTVAPDGTISTPAVGGSVAGPGQPTGIAIERLNSDGLVDMVVTGLTPEEFGSTPGVFVYPGVGISNSGFLTGGQLPLEQRPLDVAIGDFTGDGKRDFAVAMGTSAGGVEFGTNVRRFNNATVALENPVFESGPDDLLFDGQGVRRLRAAELNALPPTDYAVLGETLTGGGTGGSSSFTGGGSQGFAGARLFEPTQAPPCAGDTNGDGAVDGSDLAVLLVNWGSTGTADLDGSGAIDANDLAIMLVAWGVCP